MDKNALKSYITELAMLDASELEDDTPLFSSGVIDSISLLSLVEWVEAQVGFKVTPGQFTLENWDSVSRIARFVQNTSAR